MIFGLLKDVKSEEYRTLCTPVEIASIVAAGHRVLVQRGAGVGAGFSDEEYERAGAELAEDAATVFSVCELVAKVKEMEPSEYGYLRRGQILYCCLHPAAHPEEVQALLDAGCIAFTAEDSHRYASPNCEAAGKQGALCGLESMLTVHGGKGVFVGGFVGAPRMRVLILGGGTVGQGALSVLSALGADVTVMDVDMEKLRMLADRYGSRIGTAYCTKEAIDARLPSTDMVLNCVRWDKKRTDHLIDAEMLKTMERGSVLVDISNDPQGAIETSRETHHDDPRYVVNGVVHYCVSNIPSAVARSASIALAAETLPRLLNILNHGIQTACITDGFLRRSLTAYLGLLTHEETSAVQSRPWVRPEDALGIADEHLDAAPPATRTKSDRFYKTPDLPSR